MAGIGEASAILAIAQFGVKFSVTVWEFAGEVQGARKEIGRLVRNIRTTSERLQDIGRLLKENPVSHLFNEGGIESAVRCSSDCEDIITDVTKVLVKAGRDPSLETLEQKDLDISKLEAFRWPFVKKKLVSPQADLERVKADLMLLIHTAMALKEPNPLQSKYALEIPRLKKWSEQATRRAVNSKHQRGRSSSPLRSSSRHETRRGSTIDDGDPEMRQRFLEFQLRLAEEEEERRLKERAAYTKAEESRKQEAEIATRLEIEQEAISRYKREEKERYMRKLEREKQLKEVLGELGFEQEKIQAVIEAPGLHISEWSSANELLSSSSCPPGPKEESEAGKIQPNAPSLEALTAVEKARLKLSWLPLFSNKLRKPRSPTSSSGDTIYRSISRNPEAYNRYMGTYAKELWLIDVLSGQMIELEISQKWFDSHMNKENHHDTSRRLAQMRHQWRTAIQGFLDLRNQKEPTNLLWKLSSISLPRRVSRVPVFGHRHGDYLVKLTICRREDVYSPEPSASGRTSARPQTPNGLITTKPSVGSLTVSKKDHPVQESKSTGKLPNGNESGKEFMEPNSGLQVSPVGSKTRRKHEDWISTVEIVEEQFRDNPVQMTGFTLIPTDLISASALKELDHPFTEDTANKLSRVPSSLRDEELMELIRVTDAQMTDRQPLSTRLPGRMVVRRLGATKGTLLRENEYKINVDVIGVHFRKILYGGSTESLNKAFEESLARYRNGQVEGAAAGAKHAAKDWQQHTPRVYTAGTPARNVSRVPEYDNPYAGPHSWRPTTYNRDLEYKPSDHLITNHSRNIPKWHNHNRSYSPPTGRIRILDSSDEMSSDDSRGYRHNRRHKAVQAEALKRPYNRSRSRDRHRPADTSPVSIVISRKGYDDDAHQHEPFSRGREELDSHRRQIRSTSEEKVVFREPSPKRYDRRSRHEDIIIIPDRASHPHERQESFVSSEDWDSQQGKSQQLVRFKSSPTKSRARYRSSPRRLPSKSKAPGLIANGPTCERSPSHPNLYHETTDDDDEEEEEEEEIISRTFKRYTTFNSDVDHDIVASPEEADFSGLSDDDTFDMTTLEQAKKTLRKLVEKQEKASKDGDLMTESDLKFYAIPDVEARIQQLTSRPDQEFGDREDEVEGDGRQGPFQSEVHAYDPDNQTENSDMPDAPSGRGDLRQESESVRLQVGDRERENDLRSAQTVRNEDGSELGSEDSLTE